MKRICIIGGAGYCGTPLALALKARGDDPYVLDNFQVNHLSRWVADTSPYRDRYLRILNERLALLRAADIPLLSVDARDYHALSTALAQASPSVLIHLAAVSHQGKSNADRNLAWVHSLDTLRNALDYAIGARLDHFIWNSSSLRYGDFQGGAFEHDPVRPVGWYGAMKVMGELAIKAAQGVHGLPYTIVVPSALYGPRCVSRRVVQVFLERAFDHQPITIQGSGVERLDFTYIDDWVQAILLILDQPDRSKNEVFNVTFGQSRSMIALVELIVERMPEGSVPAIQYAPRDRDYPQRDTLYTDKIRNLLGYAPRWPLERGLDATIAWYKEFLAC